MCILDMFLHTLPLRAPSRKIKLPSSKSSHWDSRTGSTDAFSSFPIFYCPSDVMYRHPRAAYWCDCIPYNFSVAELQMPLRSYCKCSYCKLASGVRKSTLHKRAAEVCRVWDSKSGVQPLMCQWKLTPCKGRPAAWAPWHASCAMYHKCSPIPELQSTHVLYTLNSWLCAAHWHSLVSITLTTLHVFGKCHTIGSHTWKLDHASWRLVSQSRNVTQMKNNGTLKKFRNKGYDKYSCWN